MMAVMIAAAVAVVGSVLGNRKKKKAAAKEREEAKKTTYLQGAEDRRDIEYKANLERWMTQRNRAKQASGLANYGALAKPGQPGMMPFMNRWAQNAPNYQKVQDPGAMPALPVSLVDGVK
jgi:hypothetical protein